MRWCVVVTFVRKKVTQKSPLIQLRLSSVLKAKTGRIDFSLFPVGHSILRRICSKGVEAVLKILLFDELRKEETVMVITW